MLAGRGRVRGERHERGRGAHGVGGPVLGERVQDDARLEAVREDEGARVREGGDQLADHARDVEERREPEVRAAFGDAESGALALGVVRDVAVQVRGALGRAAGAGGVADERDVVRARVAAFGRPVARAGDGQEVVGVRGLRHDALEREDPLVAPRLEVQFAGGEHDPYGRVRRGLAQIRLPGSVRADQGGHVGVVQDVGDLARLVHRVDRDDGGARLVGGEQPDHEVRGVLQHEGGTVAAPEAARGEMPGDGVAELVEFAVAEAAVEVGDGGAVGGLADRGAEGVQHGVGRGHRGPLRLGELPEPGHGRVDRGAHFCAASHFCWMWFMFDSQRSGVAALAA